jgi:DNA-binding protein YbaB
MSSIGKLVKQAARAQQQMAQIQAELAVRTVETSSGGGAVKVVAKCDGSITSIKIDPQAVNQTNFLHGNEQGYSRLQFARFDVITCPCPNPSPL